MDIKNKQVRQLSCAMLICLLSACPAPDTPFDRAKSAENKAQMASIDDTAWVVTGVRIEETDESMSTSRDFTVSKNLQFVLRFDRALGVAYGHDGCQAFQVPLGQYRSGGLLSFDLSSLQLGDCGDDAQLDLQRKTIFEVLGRVSHLKVPVYHSDVAYLRLGEYIFDDNALTLEPANLIGQNLDPKLGVPLINGEIIHSSLLVADENAGLKRATVKVFRSRGAFDRAWGLNMLPGGDASAINNVDFSTNTLVAATPGIQDTSGYRVDMISSEVIDGEIKIQLKMTAPHPSCIVDNKETAAAAIYSLPTRSRLISVSTVGQVGASCADEQSLAINNLSIRVLDDTSIQLNWQQPSGAVGGYRVSAHSGQTTTTQNGEAILQGLAPGIPHQIVIVPVSSEREADAVTAYVTTKVNTAENVGFTYFDAFELTKIRTDDLPRLPSPIMSNFGNYCGHQQEVGLDLSPSDCSLSSFALSEPFSEWRTSSTLTEDESVGYHMDREGRLFVSRHAGLLSNADEFPVGFLKSRQCIEPRIVNGNFECLNQQLGVLLDNDY